MLSVTCTLNATANTSGTFSYSKSAGAVLSPGTYPLSVTFIPSDLIDYTTASAGVSLVVNKAAPVISWPVPAAIAYGVALSNAQLGAVANVAGTYNYNVAAGTLLHPGTQTLSVTFSPTDSTDYTSATASVDLVVTKATPLITWPDPAPITYGTPLSVAQLNATADVGGSYGYNIPIGTVLHAGTQLLSLTFTLSDSVDYAVVNATAHLTVNKAMLNVTADDERRGQGAANPPFTYSLSGFVNGDTAAVVSGRPILSTVADAASASGAYRITIDPNTLAASDYSFSLVPGSLLVLVGAQPVTIGASLGKWRCRRTISREIHST